MSKQYDEKNKTSFIQKQRQVVDTETGEISYETEIYKKIYGQDQFYKVYLFDLLNALGMLSTTKQLDVLIYILKNTNPSNNMFVGTYEFLASETGASTRTVQTAIKSLIKADIITLQQQGVYRVNAGLIMKGNNAKRGKLIMEYEVLKNENKKNPSDSDENPKENPNI